MKHVFQYFICILFTAFITSCQEEQIIVQNPAPEDAITVDSPIFNELLALALNEGNVDDLIDQTSCASVELPVTVIVNGLEITINSLEDIALIVALFEESQTDEDILELLFPITLVLPDYTTLVIENQEALFDFIESCTPVLPPCVDFVYPIDFSVFDIQFNLIETVTIESDFELYFFLQNIDAATEIVSINFPVDLIYDNGEVVTVTTNEELATAIDAAAENCEVTDNENPCPGDAIEAALQECFWAPTFYDGSAIYQFYHFTFLEDNIFRMSTSNAYEIEGQWSIIEEGGLTFLSINGTPPLLDPFEGNWIVTSCTDGQLILENNADVQILLTQDCGFDLAQCFGSGQGICDEDGDGFVMVDFNEIASQSICQEEGDYAYNFYLTFQDAVASVNPLPSPFETTESGTQTFYYAIQDPATGEVLYVSSYQIDAEDCNPNCENPGVLTEDLVIYIPFGNEVHELISNTFLGQAGEFVEDRDGNPTCALGFNEGDDPVFIPVTDQNRITNEDAFSISLWFKMQNDDAGDFESIFSNTLSPFTEGFSVSLYDLNTPLFVTNSDQGLWDQDWNQQVDVEWTNTDWHHLVVTVDQNNNIALYRDGVLRAEALVPELNIETEPEALNYIINVGFVGHVDDLRVYKKELNVDEINLLFDLEGDCYDCL